MASSSIQPFGHKRHEPKTGGLCPFRGAATPSNTVAWAEVYLRTNTHLDLASRLATTDMGQKSGGGERALFSGASWDAIQHKVTWAKANLHTKCHLSPSSRVATTDNGRKLGAVSLYRRGAGSRSPSNTMSRRHRSRRPRPTSAPSGILIHAAVWPQ